MNRHKIARAVLAASLVLSAVPYVEHIPTSTLSGVEIEGSPGDPYDAIAAEVIVSALDYWRGRVVDGRTVDVDAVKFVSYNALRSPVLPPTAWCGTIAKHTPSASWCGSTTRRIMWDREVFLPYQFEHFGRTGIAVPLLHEFGHDIEIALGLSRSGTVFEREQLADCFAGAALAGIAPEEIDTARRAIRDAADPLEVEPDATRHGYEWEREELLLVGFDLGPDACPLYADPDRPAVIDHAHAAERRSAVCESLSRPAYACVDRRRGLSINRPKMTAVSDPVWTVNISETAAQSVFVSLIRDSA